MNGKSSELLHRPAMYTSNNSRPGSARGEPCCVAPIIGEEVRSRSRYFVNV